LASAGILRAFRQTAKSLWFDEIMSITIATKPVAQLLSALQRFEPDPPFHYLVLNVWTAILGTGEATVRSSYVISSILVVVGT